MTRGPSPPRSGRRVPVPRVAAVLLALGLAVATARDTSMAKALPAAGNPTAGQPLQGRILFQSEIEGRWQIWVLDLATRTRKRLAATSADDTYPNFSPGGDWIAFESTREGPPAIFRMRPDGGGVERLTRGEGECRDPSWSADGRRIAYDCKREGHEEIHVLDIETRRETQITRSFWRSILPHWSPSGDWIAFSRNQLGWDVYRMKEDGSSVEKITSRGGNCRPDWSPGGKRIAYVSDVADGKGDIWTMDPDGREKERLTRDSDRHDYDPAWSPDGSWIVYQSATDKQNGPWSLYAIPAAGGEPVQLSPEGANDRFPDWGE